MPNFSTLIFDLDGTISDPSLGIYRCINYAFRSHHFPELSPEQVAAEIGPPLDEMLRKHLPQAGQSLISSLIVKYRQRYAEVGYSENELYPGVAEAIRELNRRGVRLGICTSKRRDFAEKILRMFGLLPCFAFIDGGDLGIKKRDQLSALLRVNAIDQSAVMIGDREVDISSAKANGLGSIGVLWGFGDLNELTEAGADTIIRDPEELVSLDSNQ